MHSAVFPHADLMLQFAREAFAECQQRRDRTHMPRPARPLPARRVLLLRSAAVAAGCATPSAPRPDLSGTYVDRSEGEDFACAGDDLALARVDEETLGPRSAAAPLAPQSLALRGAAAGVEAGTAPSPRATTKRRATSSVPSSWRQLWPGSIDEEP